MSSSRLIFALVAIAPLATGCPGDDTTAGSGGSSTGGADTESPASTSTGGPPPGTTADTEAATSSTGAPGTDSGSTAGTDSSGGGSDSSGSGGSTGSSGGATDSSGSGGSSTGGGMAALDVTMSGLQFFQDCMPFVPPDPAGASFNLLFDNVGMVDAGADVTSVAILDGGMNVVGTFDVAPMTFGPFAPGVMMMVGVSKVADTLDPPNGCAVLTCNASYTLQVELDVGGTPVTVEDTAMVNCVF